MPGSPTAPGQSVSFLLNEVQPPSTLYIQRDDVLALSAATSLTNEIITVNARLLDTAGRIQKIQAQIRPLNTRAVLSLVVPLAEGYLLSLSATATVALTRGQTFLRAFINTSALGAGQPGQMLFADYVTNIISSGYPNGRITSPVEGPGFVHAVTTAAGAGFDFTLVAQQNSRLKLRSLSALLTASATVANRQVRLVEVGTEGNVFLGEATANIVASQAARVYFVPGVTYAPIIATDIVVPLPVDLIIGSVSGVAQTFQSITQGIQAGDQWSQITALVEEWLDNV